MKLIPYRHHTDRGVFFTYGFDVDDARLRLAPYLPDGSTRVFLTVPTESNEGLAA